MPRPKMKGPKDHTGAPLVFRHGLHGFLNGLGNGRTLCQGSSSLYVRRYAHNPPEWPNPNAPGDYTFYRAGGVQKRGTGVLWYCRLVLMRRNVEI